MARWDRTPTKTIPDWFWKAVETPSEERRVEVAGCDVVYREWVGNGERDILFIHGMYAHSRWWDFIAPQFMNEHRVLAMDLSGMGDSDFRWEYSAETYVEEILAVCEHARLGNSVVVVAHSFGGRMATKAIAQDPNTFGALVLIDSGIRHPDEPEPDHSMMQGGRAKVYPDRATGEARFRLVPPQPCENQYLLDYIAKQSLMAADGGGYTWKFDVDLATTMIGTESQPEDFESLELPVAIIYGANSDSYSSQTHEHTVSLIPEPGLSTPIADARHHVFLDQPETFVRELRTSLEWIETQVSR